MALLSLRGFDTPSLPAQGGQRLLSYFNINRDIPVDVARNPKSARLRYSGGKTLIDKVERRFDFPSYHFNPAV